VVKTKVNLKNGKVQREKRNGRRKGILIIVDGDNEAI